MDYICITPSARRYGCAYTLGEQIVVVGYRGATGRSAEQVAVAHGAIRDGTRFAEALSGAKAIVFDGCLQLRAMTRGGSIWRLVNHGSTETGN